VEKKLIRSFRRTDVSSPFLNGPHVQRI